MLLGGIAGCALATLTKIPAGYPTLVGERRVEGVGAPVDVGRDEHGVPHVRATSDRDAWFALGFVTGQDRLYQADQSRRAAFGRLSAWIPEAAPLDRFAQTLGLRARAEAEVAALDPETRAMLDEYAAGINAAAADSRALPIEYRLLKAEFEPWTAADSLGIAYVMAWTLAENLPYELAALELRDLPTPVLDAVLRTLPDAPPLDPFWEDVRTREIAPYTEDFLAYSRAFGGVPAVAAASNNWVIAPERSADGFPIVANDPHLVQSVPSLWYAADVEGATFHAAGATLPGIPGFPIGHSERVAWGLTNVMADLVDVVVLERSGDGYVLGGEVLPFEPVEIEVAGAKETRFTTRVGPLLTTLDGPNVLALQWSATALPDELPVLLRELAGATSVEEVVNASRGRPMMVALNLVLGDVDGDTAWQTVGGMVKREGFTGRVPRPGSDPALRWDGFLLETPGERRPARGYVATANARPADPLGDAISTAYVPDHRQRRIEALLERVPKHTPDDARAIQADRLDGDATRWRDLLLAQSTAPSEDAAPCLAILRGWDLVSDKRSAGPAVWAAFVTELLDVGLAPELTLAQRDVVAALAASGRNPLDAGTLAPMLAPGDVDLALERACHVLGQTLGRDPDAWTWGELHPLRLEHPFARASKALFGPWGMTEVPFGGSGATVAAAGHAIGVRDELPVGGMQSLRVVMPLADLGASTLVYPGGQSGHPRTVTHASHYGFFVRDDALPLLYDDADLVGNIVQRLVLTPSR